MAIENEPKDKSNVTMRRTIFQQLKVLINLRKLILCWIETPMNIRSLIKWLLRFDVLMAADFFSMKYLSICYITNSFIGVWCLRKM